MASSPHDFREIVDAVKERLNKLCDKYKKVVATRTDIHEDVLGQINSTIGLSTLLVNDRFKQFEDLIKQSLDPNSKQKVLVDDLQGYWDMVYFQVEDIDSKFEHLHKLEENNFRRLPEKNIPKPKMVAKKNAPKPTVPKELLAQRGKEARNRLQKLKHELKNPVKDVAYFGVPNFFCVQSPLKDSKSAKKSKNEPTKKNIKDVSCKLQFDTEISSSGDDQQDTDASSSKDVVSGTLDEVKNNPDVFMRAQKFTDIPAKSITADEICSSILKKETLAEERIEEEEFDDNLVSETTPTFHSLSSEKIETSVELPSLTLTEANIEEEMFDYNLVSETTPSIHFFTSENIDTSVEISSVETLTEGRIDAEEFDDSLVSENTPAIIETTSSENIETLAEISSVETLIEEIIESDDYLVSENTPPIIGAVSSQNIKTLAELSSVETLIEEIIEPEESDDNLVSENTPPIIGAVSSQNIKISSVETSIEEIIEAEESDENLVSKNTSPIIGAVSSQNIKISSVETSIEEIIEAEESDENLVSKNTSPIIGAVSSQNVEISSVESSIEERIEAEESDDNLVSENTPPTIESISSENIVDLKVNEDATETYSGVLTSTPISKEKDSTPLIKLLESSRKRISDISAKPPTPEKKSRLSSFNLDQVSSNKIEQSEKKIDVSDSLDTGSCFIKRKSVESAVKISKSEQPLNKPTKSSNLGLPSNPKITGKKDSSSSRPPFKTGQKNENMATSSRNECNLSRTKPSLTKTLSKQEKMPLNRSKIQTKPSQTINKFPLRTTLSRQISNTTKVPIKSSVSLTDKNVKAKVESVKPQATFKAQFSKSQEATNLLKTKEPTKPLANKPKPITKTSTAREHASLNLPRDRIFTKKPEADNTNKRSLPTMVKPKPDLFKPDIVVANRSTLALGSKPTSTKTASQGVTNKSLLKATVSKQQPSKPFNAAKGPTKSGPLIKNVKAKVDSFRPESTLKTKSNLPDKTSKVSSTTTIKSKEPTTKPITKVPSKKDLSNKANLLKTTESVKTLANKSKNDSPVKDYPDVLKEKILEENTNPANVLSDPKDTETLTKDSMVENEPPIEERSSTTNAE